MKPFLLIATLLALTACTNRQAYDSLQGARQQECGKIVDANERARCYGVASQPYDRYEQERHR